jgi:hypothetical protein
MSEPDHAARTAEGDAGRRPVIAATELGAAGGGLAIAAGVGVVLAEERSGVLLAEVGADRGRTPTVLASRAARELEERLREREFDQVAARGRLCWLGLPAADDPLGRAAVALDAVPSHAFALVHVPPSLWLAALDDPALRPRAALLRADLPAERATAALAAIELRERGLTVRIASRPLGLVASRRVLAGLECGGAAAERIRRLARGLTGGISTEVPERGRAKRMTAAMDRGQSLPLVIGAAFAILFVTGLLAALGGAITASGRVQRAADLIALSGARSLRDDFPRLFVPPRLPGGASNPAHLDKREYLDHAAAAAREAAAHNGVDPGDVHVTFPDVRSFAPLRVEARIATAVEVAPAPGQPHADSGGRNSRVVDVAARAEAEASPPADMEQSFAGQPAVATGGGYAGPLAYRQGKGMRPDVAAAFDRLAAAARRAGISLAITSAFRSDAEQARLFAGHPDPRWVAPPGTSLHRCATELDLGPSSAYAWLAANAPRFGFLKRYSWEPWHFGWTKGPPPCSEAGNAVGMPPPAAGERLATAGLPDFVPPQFRDPILRAAARWNVSAGLLAAQLMAESNFNPFAISSAGAQGIAQFMPGTAAAYGLRDPFDAPAAIDAQAHLMSDLLRQFGGSISLALAAYNAGPGPVDACDCIPNYPETEAYVARILGLMGGAGEVAAPTLEVRLVA